MFMENTDKRVIKTKIIIKNAFLELLEEKSFEEISIAAICERALISRSTFYAHYEDKYKLLEELYEKIEKDFEGKGKNISNIKDMNNWFINVVDKNRKLLLTLLKCPTPHFEKILFNAMITGSTHAVFPEYNQNGNSLKANLDCSYTACAAIGFIKYWLEHYDEISKNEVREELYELSVKPAEIFLKRISKEYN